MVCKGGCLLFVPPDKLFLPCYTVVISPQQIKWLLLVSPQGHCLLLKQSEENQEEFKQHTQLREDGKREGQGRGRGKGEHREKKKGEKKMNRLVSPQGAQFARKDRNVIPAAPAKHSTGQTQGHLTPFLLQAAE